MLRSVYSILRGDSSLVKSFVEKVLSEDLPTPIRATRIALKRLSGGQMVDPFTRAVPSRPGSLIYCPSIRDWRSSVMSPRPSQQFYNYCSQCFSQTEKLFACCKSNGITILSIRFPILYFDLNKIRRRRVL